VRFAVLAALAACTHGEPFQTADFGSDQPAGQTAPSRLTLSGDADLDAAWLPDESGILYTGDRRDVGDARCIMLLPPTGGRAMRSLCPAVADTFNVFATSAPAAGGQLAFVRESRRRGAPFPGRAELALAPLDALRAPNTLHSIPLTLTGQPTYNAVHQVRWLSAGVLVYRGGFDGSVCPLGGPCGPGAAIPVSSGLGIVLHPLDSAVSDPLFVPGTDNASSVATAGDGDAIFYTVTGRSSVYRRAISTGAVTVVFDRPGTIVRDVQVAGNRLVVVAGGNVSAFQGQGVGLVQFDAGGDLVVVDIATGNGVVISPPNGRFQHPVLSPSGARLVAESGGDLWLFNLP
jgi:hypothetical protein